MELDRNNSIIIPPNHSVEQSYGPFYSSSDTYNEINIGSNSTFTGSYTFSGVKVKKS